MKDFLKGLGVLVALAAIIAVGYVLVMLFLAALPFIVLGVTYLLGALASLTIIVGVVAGVIYIAKEIGKSL